MSERDDIEVVKTAENSSAGASQGDSSYDGDAIRQNTPADSAEDPTKKKLGFFDMIKKAFSTDADPELEDTELSGDVDDMVGSFMERFKKRDKKEESAAQSKVEPVTAQAEQAENDNTPKQEHTDSVEAPKTAESAVSEEKESEDEPQTAQEQPSEESDPEEEEELLMIDAFLKGEEYVPAEQEEEQPSEDETEDKTEDEGIDLSDALEDEDAVFVEFEADAEEEPQSDAQIAAPEEQEVTGNDENKENVDSGADDEAADKGEASDESAAVTEDTADEEEAGDSEDKASEAVLPDESADGSEPESGESTAEAEDKDEEHREAETSESGETSAEPQSADSGEDEHEVALTDEDDEEFVLEEDMLFDEGDDDVSDLVKLDGGDDYGELSTIFSENEENSAENKKVPDTKEYVAESNADPLDISGEDDPESDIDESDAEDGGSDLSAPEEISDEAEKLPEETAKETAEAQTAQPESTETAEEKAEEKTEDKTEDEIKETEDKADAAAETAAAKEESSEEKPAESAAAPAEETAVRAEPEAADIGAQSSEQAAAKPAEGKKSFFVRVKTKLAELWNAKSEPEKTEAPAEQDPFVAELVSDDTAEETKPEEAKSEETKSEEAKSEETKSEEAKSEETKPEETKPEETKPEETKPEEAKPEETKLEETEPEGENDEEEDTSRRLPMISVIKNENVTRTEFDEEKLRGSLNVIERKATDVLTDEQRRELEENKLRLERVTELEARSEAEKEELRRETEQRKAKEAAQADKVITELEVTDYRFETETPITFGAGRFVDCVRAEYECIANYRRMSSVSSNENLLKEITADSEEKAPVPENGKESKMPEIGESENPALKEARDFERNHDKVESIGNKLDYQDQRDPEPIEYRTEEDAPEVRRHLSERRKKDSWVFGVTAGLTVAAFIFSLFARKFTVGAAADAQAGLQRGFAAINFIIYGCAVFFCKDILLGGLLPLKKFKANSDTGLAVAACAAALQSLFAIIAPASFMSQGLNIYTLVVMLALTLFSAGRYLNSDRKAANFRFVSDGEQKYAGKFFTDPRTVAKLLSGTKNDKTEFSFQKKTSFLKHFMKLSNADDPGDKLAYSFSLPTILLSVLVALIAGIMSKNFFDALSVLTIMLCAGIPISSRALGAWPIRTLAKKALVNKSMVVGYSAVDTFSESAAVMIDAKDLYPSGSIQMNRVIRYDNELWLEGIYAAAAITLEAGGAMSGIFDQLIKDQQTAVTPKAEGVMYEDGKGLLGWVRNKRVLVGNRQLLLGHGVPVVSAKDDNDFKENGDEPLYIAVGDRLVGVITVTYTASHRVSDVLKRMEASDMSLLVRTTDVNITAERISRDFGVSLKSIKVLEQKTFNFIRDEMVGKERSSPAFIATKGGVTSFGMAVSECVQTKRDISLSTAVEIAGTLVKMLIICAIVLFAGIHQIGALQIFIFSLLWAAIVLCAPMIVQKIQGNK